MVNPLSLESVSTTFNDWRRHRPSSKGRIPLVLQKQAIELLAFYSKSQVLNRYKIIWMNDDMTQEQGLCDADRLAFHREHSLPVMAQIRDWGECQLDDKTV